MQICEYFFENACYSVTKYYLCKQNNKRSLLGRKQQHQVVRSFPNRYLFSLTNKVTYLFPISCILEIILSGKYAVIAWQIRRNCLPNSPCLLTKSGGLASRQSITWAVLDCRRAAFLPRTTVPSTHRSREAPREASAVYAR